MAEDARAGTTPGPSPSNYHSGLLGGPAPAPASLAAIDWRVAFPFTHLFRAFRVAIHPGKLILALAAIFLMYGLGRTMDWVWPTQHSYVASSFAVGDAFAHGFEPARSVTERASLAGDAPEIHGPFAVFLRAELRAFTAIVDRVLSADLPGAAYATATLFFQYPVEAWQSHWVYFTIYFLIGLLVFSIFGGAIARIAAVHVARDEKMSVRQALRFSSGKLLSFVFAPLIPLIIVAAIALLIATGGTLLYVKWFGELAVALLFPLTLLVSFVMTLVLFGTLGGFSLMYPTVAVEGSDSFDAISRSFSYVYARPWRTLFYALVSLVYGVLTYSFVALFIWCVLSLAHSVTGAFLLDNVTQDTPVTASPLRGGPTLELTGPSRAQQNWDAIWPGPVGGELLYNVDYDNLSFTQRIAAGIMSLWVYTVIALLGAFVISFYFSATTIIYYLLRADVDATEMDDVYLEHGDDDFGELPTDGKPGDGKPGDVKPGESRPGEGQTPQSIPAESRSPASTPADSTATSSTGASSTGAHAGADTKPPELAPPAPGQAG